MGKPSKADRYLPWKLVEEVRRLLACQPRPVNLPRPGRVKVECLEGGCLLLHLPQHWPGHPAGNRD